MQRQVVRLTRQELYEKMWSRPAISLAEEFGISGRGLGKICSRSYLSDGKLILKVSYNIGADTSLLLYGLTQGVDNMTAKCASALAG